MSGSPPPYRRVHSSKLGKAPEPERRVGKITSTSSSVTVRSSTVETGTGEFKTALLTPTADQQDGKNGSHAPSEATIAVEETETEVEKTVEGGVKTRKLSQIKKRVSQEFEESTTAKKWLIWIGHLLGASVPYVAILMGAVYRDECPANRNIPLHLIVSGVVTALLHLSTSIDMHRKLSYLRENQKPAIFSLLALFLFIWMILGCVWTFGIYTPEYDYGQFYPYTAGYCHKALYWFAFVFNVVSLVSFLMGWLLCCCVCSILCHTSILTCLCVKKCKEYQREAEEEEEAATPVQV
ncbi:Transmembrane protein 272 [Frankliniella fusca]|uniref:Transmembrane protein 272 n=1 Tax=Frankliniella fusca TaxID=407009 RepID=A0AAE1LQT8_9NEOP|nr:Transmembrane protein 272 [Frankliniella fusca]